MIIYGSSCANVASTRLVEKLGLPIISHTKPYKLHCLSEEGGIMVNKQFLIIFAIGKHKDEILCDVVPMEATHSTRKALAICVKLEALMSPNP